MSQERIIRFSLQHSFLVKHPYENMVSFVTHVKRSSKAIFFLIVYVSWALYLSKTSSNTRNPCLRNIVYYWEFVTFYLSLISMIVIKIDMSSERGEEKCRIPRELSLATLFALFLIFWTYFSITICQNDFPSYSMCPFAHRYISFFENNNFSYKTLSLSSQTNK